MVFYSRYINGVCYSIPCYIIEIYPILALLISYIASGTDRELLLTKLQSICKAMEFTREIDIKMTKM